MVESIFFVMPCPACNRATQILVSYLGKQICCRHCRREFTARDPNAESAADLDPVNYWVNYTETKLPSDYEFPNSHRFPR